jgi:uncharacterized protein
MTTLSDKLKSLGVQMGAKNLLNPSTTKIMTLEEATGGHILETINGETFIVDTIIAAKSTVPHPTLNISPSFTGLSRWINNSSLNDISLEQICFVDIETTGLSGGSGTFAFLVGAGRFDKDTFLTRQFFLRDPSEENAQLTAFDEFIAPCRALVTFNGKSFDAPIINARFTIQGWRSPLLGLIHIDLLHLARRLWPNRLPSRTLGNLEIQILNSSRTEQDIPGWMIPQIYMDYLHYGDSSPMKQVFYHNLQDVITLAKLLNYTSHLLAEPLSGIIEYGVDLIAIARLFEDIGDTMLAADLYFQGLDYELPKNIMLDAIHRLSLIHKRKQNYAEAVILWERAAQHQYLEAYIELAKYFEHHVQEYSSALYWTESAIEIVNSDPNIYKKEIIENLNHRFKRLNRLQGKQSTTSTDASI